MFYCPGNEQQLLSTLVVTLKCHAFNVFLVLKEPLPKLEPLSKSMAWLLDQALLAIIELLAAVLMFLKCSFLGILKALPVFPIYHHEQFVRGILYTALVCGVISSKVGILESGKWFVYNCDIVRF